MTATAEKSAFRQVVEVSIDIAAAPEAVWSRLTDAGGFPAWNSTVESIEGPIELGRRLAIRVPSAPGRTFRPRVVEFEPPRRMVWRDGAMPMFQGTRTYTVGPASTGVTFTMREEFRGLMLPLIARSLPDFVPIFDQYAADLKAACER